MNWAQPAGLLLYGNFFIENCQRPPGVSPFNCLNRVLSVTFAYTLYTVAVQTGSLLKTQGSGTSGAQSPGGCTQLKEACVTIPNQRSISLVKLVGFRSLWVKVKERNVGQQTQRHRPTSTAKPWKKIQIGTSTTQKCTAEEPEGAQRDRIELAILPTSSAPLPARPYISISLVEGGAERWEGHPTLSPPPKL